MEKKTMSLSATISKETVDAVKKHLMSFLTPACEKKGICLKMLDDDVNVQTRQLQYGMGCVAVVPGQMETWLTTLNRDSDDTNKVHIAIKCIVNGMVDGLQPEDVLEIQLKHGMTVTSELAVNRYNGINEGILSIKVWVEKMKKPMLNADDDDNIFLTKKAMDVIQNHIMHLLTAECVLKKFCLKVLPADQTFQEGMYQILIVGNGAEPVNRATMEKLLATLNNDSDDSNGVHSAIRSVVNRMVRDIQEGDVLGFLPVKIICMGSYVKCQLSTSLWMKIEPKKIGVSP